MSHRKSNNWFGTNLETLSIKATSKYEMWLLFREKLLENNPNYDIYYYYYIMNLINDEIDVQPDIVYKLSNIINLLLNNFN